MTNYNKRLDEILSYEHEVEGCQASHAGSKCLHCNEDPCPHCKRWGGMQRTEVRSMVDKKTKQALTSLMKELVEEAKPKDYVPEGHEPDARLNHEKYTSACCGCQRQRARVNSLDEFEQNLLKGLE